MNAIAKSFPGGVAGSTERRQLIFLAVLSVVLVVLLVWQVPKLLGGSGSSSEAAPAASPTVASAAASAATPAAAVAAASFAAPTGPAARRTERWINSQPARDPFVPLTAPAVSEPTPVPVAPAAPDVAPTAAVIWTNGRRQVVGVKQRFKMGDTTFRLVSVTRTSAEVDPVVGSLAGGGELTLSRAKPRTIESSKTGAQYRITFSHPLAVVPSS
jgi:hypothetical protein